MWQAIVLGCVQGLSEFLPISSSGHLVLFQRILALPQHDILFDVAVHLATVLAIVSVYRQKFFDLARQSWARPSSEGGAFVGHLALGSLPAAGVGLLFRPQVEQLFSSLVSTGVGFLCTAALIGYAALKSKSTTHGRDVAIDWRVALVVGVAQALAMAPGLSRSGATIATALLMGVKPERAAFFSFSLAVPVILGAGVLKFLSVPQWSWQGAYVLLVGMVSAYVMGLVALRCVVALVVRSRWQVFAWYLAPLGLVCILWDL